MRILFVIHMYPPHHFGGHELRCQQTVRRLRERGHEVTVLTGARGCDGPTIDGSVHRVLRTRFTEHVGHPIGWVSIYRHNLKAYHGLVRVFRPDVVALWDITAAGKALHVPIIQKTSVPVCCFPGGPQTIDVNHGNPWFHFCNTPARRPLARLAKRFLTGALSAVAPTRADGLTFDKVVFPSQYLADSAERLGLAIGDPVVVPTGVDVARFHGREPEAYNRPPKLLFLGRLDHEKAPDLPIRALSSLKKAGCGGLSLTMAGPEFIPGLRGVLEELVSETGLIDQVCFLGEVPHDEVPELLRSHDVLVMSSPSEGNPNAVLEAMASGLAVVCTRCGGPEEYLTHGENALLYGVGDVDRLAAHLRELAGDPALVSRLGQAGQSLVRTKYTLDAMIDGVERELLALCATGTGGELPNASIKTDRA